MESLDMLVCMIVSLWYYILITRFATKILVRDEKELEWFAKDRRTIFIVCKRGFQELPNLFVHSMHSCITRTPNFGLRDSRKKKEYDNTNWHFLCIIRTNVFFLFLEFVAVKFNLNLVFVQLFITSHWLKIRIYIIYIV